MFRVHIPVQSGVQSLRLPTKTRMQVVLVVLAVVAAVVFANDGSGAGTVIPWHGQIGETLTLQGSGDLLRVDNDGKEAYYVKCYKTTPTKLPSHCGKWTSGGKDIKLGVKITYGDNDVKIANLGSEDYHVKYGFLGREQTEINFPLN